MVVFVFGADAVGWWLDSFPVFGSSCRGGFSLGEAVEAFLRAGRFQVGGQFRALATALTQVRGRALEAVESLVGLVGANHFQVVGIAVYPGGVEVQVGWRSPSVARILPRAWPRMLSASRLATLVRYRQMPARAWAIR